jgi:hypothetical protein
VEVQGHWVERDLVEEEQEREAAGTIVGLAADLDRLGDFEVLLAAGRECAVEATQRYIFADKFLVQGLKEDIIRTLFYLRSQNAPAPQPPLVVFIFGQMPQHSPFRKLLVD